MKSDDNIIKGKTSARRRNILCIIIVAIVAIVITTDYTLKRFDGNPTWVYIPNDANDNQVKDSLISALGQVDGKRTYILWKLQGGSPTKSHGAYRISSGGRFLNLAHKMCRGQQTPVRITWNEARSINEASEKITYGLECTSEDFYTTFDSIMTTKGINNAEYMTSFFPDTYEFYWTASPESIIEKLVSYTNDFWDDDRKKKATSIGLTPSEVVTIASIVEEESSKRDEFGNIARLYLNRLQKGMPLQADPTVKYAYGDPTIKRITEKHIAVDSPYNTYKHRGLPPGPIRFVEKRTIDAVLNAPSHHYLYMCAKEDFSGYHNFATNYADHLSNARRYQAAINNKGIY